MDYIHEIITPPTIPDGWLGRAKRQLQIEADESADDLFLAELLDDAADFVGDRSDMAVLETGFRLTVPRFPCSSLHPIYLPRPPLVSVQAITYLDHDGQRQSMDLANVDESTGQVSLVQMKVGNTRPSALCRRDSVQVDYTAGTTTPKAALRAILLLVGHWHLNRDGCPLFGCRG